MNTFMLAAQRLHKRPEIVEFLVVFPEALLDNPLFVGSDLTDFDLSGSKPLLQLGKTLLGITSGVCGGVYFGA